MMKENHTLCVFSDNHPGVLQRITGLFTRRKLNIESLTVSETERSSVSRFTILVNAESDIVEKVARQIGKIIEVRDLYICHDEELLFREIAFYKVKYQGKEHYSQLKQRLDDIGAAISFNDEEKIIIEMTGSEIEIQVLYNILKNQGLIEFVRSGRIAILRDKREPHHASRAPQMRAEEDGSI
jgi:acetolactate synthase-1/3 small subunit